jgi:hypothetical protein
LQKGFAGGFVLENEPTGRGFWGWFHEKWSHFGSKVGSFYLETQEANLQTPHLNPVPYTTTGLPREYSVRRLADSARPTRLPRRGEEMAERCGCGEYRDRSIAPAFRSEKDSK